MRSTSNPRWKGALARPLLFTLAAVSLLCLALVARAQGGQVESGDERGSSVTVFLVRHAEKSNDDPRDPSLSEQGEARAKQLAHTLGAAGVTHLFSTPYKRTRSTLEPLAAARELEVLEYDPRDPRGLLKALAGLPGGSCAVVAGHSNTTPGYYAALGGEAQGLEPSSHGQLLPEDAYDRLFMVTFSNEVSSSSEGDGERVVHAALELRYGD